VSLPLSQASLARVAALRVDGNAPDIPRYARRSDLRICHLGLGRFHRAHQAHYLHRLLQDGLADGWGLCGIGLRAADAGVVAALRAQDGLYSLWEVDGTSRRVSVIGSIMELVDASDDIGRAIEAIADSRTRIVSLTITEAGYCLDGSGALDVSHPEIVHDLADPQVPRSAAGVICAALQVRRAAGAGGVTLMSCDNLIGNGHALRRSVLGLAQRTDAALAHWIEDRCSFPSSMVDRITPGAAHVDSLAAEWGVADAALVMCEPWQQWILEDDFVAGRPPFERAGVVLSAAVKRYEDVKVGLLNGGHSAIAHCGLLLGHTRVHHAVADASIRGWLTAYMRDVAATLAPPPGLDLAAYQAALVQRFANPAIDDRLLRLAQDTSAKFQQVLLPPLLRRLERGLEVDNFALAIALWMTYLRTLDADRGARGAYLDARKDALIPLARGAAGAFVAASLPLPDAQSSAFAARVDARLRDLTRDGVAALLRATH
jgi:mannitol 2-dehydrogenase